MSAWTSSIWAQQPRLQGPEGMCAGQRTSCEVWTRSINWRMRMAGHKLQACKPAQAAVRPVQAAALEQQLGACSMATGPPGPLAAAATGHAHSNLVSDASALQHLHPPSPRGTDGHASERPALDELVASLFEVRGLLLPWSGVRDISCASRALIVVASHAVQCNICLELARDPVVTLCGHLYCWPCLFR